MNKNSTCFPDPLLRKAKTNCHLGRIISPHQCLPPSSLVPAEGWKQSQSGRLLEGALVVGMRTRLPGSAGEERNPQPHAHTPLTKGKNAFTNGGRAGEELA